jgi:hypothetical protein
VEDQPLEPVRRHHDVVVDEDDVVAARALQRLVARARRAEIVGVRDERDVALLGEPLGAAVARAVVDE